MKVLYITNVAAPYRVEFLNELSKYCNLTVLFERRKASDRNENWYSNEFMFEAIFLKSINIGNDSSISYDIIKFLKKDYDIIVLGGYSTFTAMIASIYMRIKNISYILNADGGFICENEKLVIKYIKSFFVSSATNWLSSGKETNKYLVFYGAKIDNIFNFPFTSLRSSDILKEPISERKKIFLKKNMGIPYKKVIISVGQYIRRKGFDWMIDAYKNLDSDIGIYIIGGKPTQEYLGLRDKYQMANLHFVDFKNKEDLKIWYQMADLFVLPTREDIWGLVINEAMSQGLPIITTNKCIAGIELVKNNKNGYIVECENNHDLCLKTNMILKSDSYEYGKMSLYYINSYTIENMAKTTYDIFKRILD